MSLIGLENMHYAILTKDDSTGIEYGTPTILSGAISINENAQSNTAELYADNRLWETDTVFSKGEVELNLADLALSDYASLCGHSIDGSGKLIENVNDVAPYVCLMGEAMKGDKVNKRYFKLLKGQCAKVGLDMKTKTNNPEYTTPTLKATFMPRQYDGNYKYVKDYSTNTAESITSAWYSNVE